MLCCRWFKLSMSIILTTTISIILCAPQNELRYTKSIQFPVESNVNNYQSLGIRLQTSFPEPRRLSIFNTKINNNAKSEKPQTPYPYIKPRIKYIEMNKNNDISLTECAGTLNLDCIDNKKELNAEIYKHFVKDVKPKVDKENNTHESTTESSTDLSLDTTTDFPNESTIDFTTEYESTTGDEDLSNRLAVPPHVVASLLG